MTPEMAQGAYITESGVPSNCVQIPTYNALSRRFRPSIPTTLNRLQVRTTCAGGSHLRAIGGTKVAGQCEHSVWFDKSVDGLPGRPPLPHQLRLGTCPRPSTAWLLLVPRATKRDWLDCRLVNLKLITPREEDGRSLLPIKSSVTPGLKLINHDNDRVSARLGSTLHRHSQIP